MGAASLGKGIALLARGLDMGKHQGCTVPHGVEHRTRAPNKTVMLMVEGAAVVPTGDS